MKRIDSYEEFLILEKYDKNIKKELKKLGVTNRKELKEHLYNAHRGNLATYLKNQGEKFTFGMLIALFKDAQTAKKKSNMKVGIIKMAHRALPMVLSPFFPILAIVSFIFSGSRAVNKIIKPILSDPGNNYPQFLSKLITSTMKVAEGELPTKDRFTRAFVVSDAIVDAIKPEVLAEFSIFLSEKMSNENSEKEVPSYYIENHLKTYLNDNFHIEPRIPLKRKGKR